MNAGGAFLAGAASGSTFAAPRSVRFGVRTPLPDLGLRERALLVKRLGFDGIELGDDWSAKPLEFLQKELDGTGVAVSAVVGSIGLLDTDPEKRS